MLEPLELKKRETNGIDPLKEANLSRHLTNGKKAGSKDAKAVMKALKEKKEEKSLAQTDYELYEALNLLKGIALAEPKS